MYSGTRKFVPNQRSVPKQQRASYQQFPTNYKQQSNPYYVQYGSKKQLTKTSSDADLKHPKQEYFKNLNQRRKNQGQMSNLKSQLQNLKNQVNKLINKQTTLRTPQKQKAPIKQQRSDKKINYLTKGFHDEYTDRQQDFSDTASMTSVTTEKVLNQPLRRLQRKANNQNFDQGYYMQLQNELLKTQIKNLKNKYVSKKRQLTQKCDLLQKKNQFLQISLQKSQQSLVECRKALQMQIMVIKKQITLKTQIKNQNQPQTDRIQVQGNEMLKQKIKRLYDQLTQKNKTINNFNIQIGDLEAMLQRKKFELKKQSQKNLQLSKQIQLSKRQNSRLQILIQTQISKKKDLTKQNQQLKQKNKQLMNQIYTKQQIVSGSQQYQNRLSQQLEEYKKRQDSLQIKLSEIRDQYKKLKQITDSDKDQINYLKKSNDDTLGRISQLSKKLKQEQQKNLQKEQYYRKLIDQIKRKEQQKIRIIRQQYESQTVHLNQQITKKQDKQSSQLSELLRQKDRQINKWKAEYKILKLKHQQKQNSQQIKKQQIEQYFQGYKKFKHTSQMLEERNKMLQRNVQNYLRKLSDKQAEGMKLQLQHKRSEQSLKLQIIKLRNQIQSANDQLQQVKNQLSQITLKNDQEVIYRQDLQSKIQKFIQKQLKGQSSDDQDEEFQSIKNIEYNEQGELTPQKPKRQFVQQGQDQHQFQQPSKKQIRKPTKSKTQKVKPTVQLTQSQKLQLQQLSEAITSVKKRLIQQDQKLSKSIKQLKNKQTQITKLKKQIRQLLQTHQRQLTQIKQKYSSDKIDLQIKTSLDTQKQVKQLCSKQIQIYKQKYSQILSQNVQMKRKLSEIQKQSLDLKQQTKSFSHLYNVKCAEVEQISQKYHNQITSRDKRYDDLLLLKNQKQNNMNNQINNLKDQILNLRIDIKNLLSSNKKIQTNNFDQALKNQIETNKTLRQELTKKNQELFKVRDNYTLLRSQYDNLRSQIQIEKLKNISQKKNIQIQYQIEIQNLKNRLSVQQKKISSLQQKIALVIQQNKKKDSFIQSYIMGKKLPQGDKEFVSQFVKQYQINLSGKNINEKLKADSNQLQKMAIYNYRLLKDMAEMKQKMLLYETMQGQALSLYDSRHSGEINRQNDFDSVQSPSKSSNNNSPKTPNKRFKKMYSLAQNEISLDLGDRSK